MSRGHCKQCYQYSYCEAKMPEAHEFGIWNSIEDKRKWMQGHMMDCFKSPQQHDRDIKCAEKSRQFGRKEVL